MDAVTLVPAYGRDYRSKKDVLADWNGGKDFLIRSYGHPYDGKVMSIRDVKPGETYHIRYNQLRKIAVVTVK